MVTLDTLTLGWRPRDLALASFPQLKGLCLANYFSDPVFRARLAAPPEDDVMAATGLWAMIFGNQSLTWDDLRLAPLADDAADPAQGHLLAATTPGARSTPGWTASTAPTTAAARRTAGCRRWTAWPRCSARPTAFRSSSTPASAAVPDVLKALAIGASAVAIGRPYAYGLAVGGQAGIEHVVRCLLAEMDLTMAIDGYPSIADLTREAVRPVPAG